MKNNVKQQSILGLKGRVAAVILAMLLCISCFPAVYSAAQEIVPTHYYGRSALAVLDRADVLLYAYDQIASGIEQHADEISLSGDGFSVQRSDLATVYDAYVNDYPQHFWRSNSYQYSYYGQTVLSFMPDYWINEADLSEAKNTFEQEVVQLLDGVEELENEFDREKLIHDRLADRVVYASGENAHNAYGAIVEGKAVCDGYSRAFQYLLYRAGIQSFVVTGSSINPSTGLAEGHAWNLVRINGEYYHTDLTWNDQSSGIFYAYFNVSQERIEEDHMIDEKAYSLPEAMSTHDSYFSVYGGIVENPDIQQIGELLAKGGLSARIYCTADNYTEFGIWFSENVAQIAHAAGVSGAFLYVYRTLGREYDLMLLQPGDVNGDGCVRFADVLLAAKFAAGIQTANEYELFLADMNQSGSVDLADVLAIARMAAKIL